MALGSRVRAGQDRPADADAVSYLIFVLMLWSVGSLGVGYLMGRWESADELALRDYQWKRALEKYDLTLRPSPPPDVSYGPGPDSQPLDPRAVGMANAAHYVVPTAEEHREMYGRRRS